MVSQKESVFNFFKSDSDEKIRIRFSFSCWLLWCFYLDRIFFLIITVTKRRGPCIFFFNLPCIFEFACDYFRCQLSECSLIGQRKSISVLFLQIGPRWKNKNSIQLFLLIFVVFFLGQDLFPYHRSKQKKGPLFLFYWIHWVFSNTHVIIFVFN